MFDDEDIAPENVYGDVPMTAPSLFSDNEDAVDWASDLEAELERELRAEAQTPSSPTLLPTKVIPKPSGADSASVPHDKKAYLAGINHKIAHPEDMDLDEEGDVAETASASPSPEPEDAVEEASPQPASTTVPTAKSLRFRKNVRVEAAPSAAATASVTTTPAKRAREETDGNTADTPRTAPATRTAASTPVKTTGRSNGGRKGKSAEPAARPKPADDKIDIANAKSYATVVPSTPKTNPPSKPKAELISRITEEPLKNRISSRKAESVTLAPPGSDAPHNMELRVEELIPYLEKFGQEMLLRHGLRRVGGSFIPQHVASWAECKAVCSGFRGRALFCMNVAYWRKYAEAFVAYEKNFNFPWERDNHGVIYTMEDMQTLMLKNGIHPFTIKDSGSWAVEVLSAVEFDKTSLSPALRAQAQAALRTLLSDPTTFSCQHPGWHSPRWVAAIEHVRSNPKQHGATPTAPMAPTAPAPATTSATTSTPSTEQEIIEVDAPEAGPSARRAPTRAAGRKPRAATVKKANVPA